ncbi:NADH-quinone oxidoreductase subunit L [Stackebrandtia soli]|uniref:NADH-quinone oxidoreductase subunit 5 family protein n=1 Tax=Stackebrandtia soli TaxID=1892856 RepID=UPI0039E7808C
MIAAVALVLVPAVAAGVGLLLPLTARRAAAVLALAASGVAVLASIVLLWTDVSGSVVLADFGDVAVSAAIDVSGPAAPVAVAVTAVTFLVQLYSMSYLDDDERYAPYAAQIGLFAAAMLLVVVADDLVLLLIGWEVMGACSYLLIGHDRRLPEAPRAAVKAFLVTRVGDVGFLLGLVLLAVHTGTFRVSEIVATAPRELSAGVLAAACLLILAGAVGKSAQFPLHTWLPDAMAGPTPVSALIHAATMVAAGAYVLVRLFPLYAASPAVLTVIAVIAAVTMLLGACAALAADDLKRVLAWSTVSQVAYMFAAVAAEGTTESVVYLLAHAAFKALLFLGAGVVIHMVGTNAMAAMGGLRHGAPVTMWTMTIGFAALAGVPFLPGFWAKEAVLGAAVDAGGTIVLVAGVITAGLTAAYAARAWLRVFAGEPRGAVHAADPPLPQRIPLFVLAGATLVGSLGLTVWFLWFSQRNPLAHWPILLLVVAVTVVGAGGVYLLWRRDPGADPARRLGRAKAFLAGGCGIDRIQDALVVRPVLGAAHVARGLDVAFIDGAVEGTGTATMSVARRAASAHRFGLPAHLLAGLGGVLLVAALAVVLTGGSP